MVNDGSLFSFLTIPQQLIGYIEEVQWPNPATITMVGRSLANGIFLGNSDSRFDFRESKCD